MRKNWVKKSPYDYEQNRGKQYRRDRITDVAELVKSVKKARSPAANHYKIKHTKRILGPANSKSAQLQSVANSQWYGKQTPGYHYKPNTKLTKPNSPAMLMYPRTKTEGGGPGLKAIKRDRDGGPGFYKVDQK